MERTKMAWIAKLPLGVFGFEVSAALVAAIWSHNVTHAGEWQELTRTVIDFFIWICLMLCSLLFGAIALVQRVKRRNTIEINFRAATWGFILHGAVLITGLVVLWLAMA